MTTFETKCDIIEEFMRENIIDDSIFSDDIVDFVSFNDLGIPLAQAVSYELAELTASGRLLVEETWINFCEMLSIDIDGDYEDLDDCLGYQGDTND